MTTTTTTRSGLIGQLHINQRIITGYSKPCEDSIKLKHIWLSPVWDIDMENVAYWMIFTYKYGYLGRTRTIKDLLDAKEIKVQIIW